MEKIDKLYEKIHGGYFALIGAAIAIILYSIAIILYISGDPSFSLYTHYISHLGVGPNGANIVFMIATILSAIFMILFHLYFMRFLQQKGGGQNLTWLCFILGFISAIGLIIVAIFPRDTHAVVHSSGTLIYFIAAFIFLIVYSYIELKIEEISKIQPIINCIVAIFFITFLVFRIGNRMNLGLNPEFEHFSEWMQLFAIIAWFIEYGLFTLKTD